MITIRDTVHGDIVLSDIFADIIDTPEFQRLRSIEQGSFRPAFPGARHDRFIHSLGTYHLATKFAEHFFRNISKDASGPSMDKEKILALTTTFRYAALLHDIGHAPYSHTTEEFFMRKEVNKVPVVVEDLRSAVNSLNSPMEAGTFDDDYDYCLNNNKPAPHEIISATLLIRNRGSFLIPHKNEVDTKLPALAKLVDPALAARMVIGCTYDYNRYGHLDPKEKYELGVRNCLIRLLNSKTLDVDRLDYLIRDTQMSGFVNMPINADALAQSVTAVRRDNSDWLYPAFRNEAMGVLESMFYAKREHDLWVLAHPAGAYDAALRAHCIEHMEDLPGNTDYMTTVFTAEALGLKGVEVEGRTYRLLNDDDIGADLKRGFDDSPLIQELFCRDRRRVTIWKDYYEFNWLFNWEKKPDGQTQPRKLTEEMVFTFFDALMTYMEKEKLFQLDETTYQQLMRDPKSTDARKAATFLHNFFSTLTVPGRPDAKAFDLVLLRCTANLTYKFKPEEIFITFRKLPATGDLNYTTYAALKRTDGTTDQRKLFYLFAPKGVMYAQKQAAFRNALLDEICPAKAIQHPPV